MFFTIYISSVIATILFTICYLIKFSEIAKEYKIKNRDNYKIFLNKKYFNSIEIKLFIF